LGSAPGARHHRPAAKAHGRSGGRRFQTYITKDGAYIRKNFFGKYPELLDLVSHLSDDQLMKLRRGGHDPKKVYNAYKAAVETTGGPTLILAHTIKGYGLGEAGEGRNITHQQKKLNEQEIAHFRSRFEIPIPDEAARNASFYRPPADSPEMAYMHERRRSAGRLHAHRATPASAAGSAAARVSSRNRWPVRKGREVPAPWPSSAC
jgi:pyruvate dehydrogenase complex dehydrogenase (E1) component